MVSKKLDSFDYHLLEALHKSRNIESVEDATHRPEVEKLVRERISNILDAFFIYVPAHHSLPEEVSTWQKALKVYTVWIGTVVLAEYDNERKAYYYGGSKVPWNRLYGSEAEAIASISSKLGRK
jgi:hypothetical protein